MSALRLEAFAPAVPGAPLLAPWTVALARGDILALVGPSGVGKTTLLRAIAGLAPAQGTVVADDVEVHDLPAERRRLVYLHQQPRLFPHLDVAGNVAFPLAVRGVAPREARRRAELLLGRVHLDGVARRTVAGLSGGERQRVALARALAVEPAALLLDEPFAALDPALREAVRQALREAIADGGPAALLVTHDLEEAAALAGRIAVLLDGAVRQVAPPERLFDAPATEAIARFLELGTVWPRAALHALGVTLPDPARTALLRDGTLRARPDPRGAARFLRPLVTRTRRLAVVQLGELEGRAALPGPFPEPGAPLALELAPERMTLFGPDGHAIPPE